MFSYKEITMTEDNLRKATHRFPWRLLRGVLAVLLLVGLTAEAPAQRLAKSRLKNGSSVRNAFREVVSHARLSTIVVLSKGKQVALGTVVDSDGYVLTKASEVREREDISCRLKDGHSVEARVVGIEPEYDLAMLKIEAEGLTAAQWNSQFSEAIGQWLATSGVDAIPLAVGVMSVRSRRISPLPGFLGVSLEQDEPGPRIVHVFPQTGASRAGLREGDLITHIGESETRDRSSLIEMIRRYRPGDTLKLSVMRDRTEIALNATLGARPIDPRNRSEIQNQMGGELSDRRAGFPAVFQHDTVLRPEECGGPVVDLSGRVVGINIARAGRTETYAVPVGKILPLIGDLKSGRLAPPMENSIAGPAEPATLPEGS